jgi:hypothetical protein
MADKLAFEQNQIPLNLKPRVKLKSWISHRVNYICHNDRRLSRLNVANAVNFHCLCPVQLKLVSDLLWIVFTTSTSNRWHARF